MIVKVSLTFLILINFNAYIINASFLTDLFSLDSNLDKDYTSGFADLLDPRNLLKDSNNFTNEIYTEVARKLGASDEIKKLAKAKVPEMIEHHGYPVEVHSVLTEDGYILGLHRIPHGRFGMQMEKRGSVILAHGILCSSACWLFLGPRRALPYILADLGYDVWLLNVRGNTYSRNHTKLNPDRDAKFWKFSFHEVGKYDFPAIIDYVKLHAVQSEVFFVAHSLSTTAFYVMCSERPEYNQYIRAHFSLAPAAYMKHQKNPLLKFLSKFSNIWNTIGHLIGFDEFLPNHKLLNRVAGKLCTVKPLSNLICANAMFVVCGFNKKQLNSTILPVIFGHTPSGTSLRTLVHYAQLVSNFKETFQYFSYGLKNTYIYQSVFAPEYHLERVTAPSYCFYSRGDRLVSDRDAAKTCLKLVHLEDKFVAQDNDWSHNDYVYGTDAKEEIYDKIVELMQRY